MVGRNTEAVVRTDVEAQKVDETFTSSDHEHCGPTVGTAAITDATYDDSRRTPSNIVTVHKPSSMQKRWEEDPKVEHYI